jgi:hypothetical protein
MNGSATPDLLIVAAEFLQRYGDPIARRRLVSEHTPDGRGRCRAHHETIDSSPRWPCILHLIGVAAQRLPS